MSESWDEYAEGWDSNEAVIAYSEKAYDSLLSKVTIAGANVFDFGCGTGLLTEKIAQQATSVVALDASKKMIAVLEAKEVKNMTPLAAELSEQLLLDHQFHAKFDLVVASSVLAFVANLADTLSLLKRLLKPEGQIVHWDWRKLNEDEGFGFTPEEVQANLTAAGFQNVDVSIPFSVATEKERMEVVMGVAVRLFGK